MTLFSRIIGGFTALARGKRVERELDDEPLLYGVEPRSAVIHGGRRVPVAVTLVATLLPAWRAMRLDPLTALREE